MTVTELLAGFANPEVIETLSTSDKLLAGLATTILGMGITFSALVILQFIISWMDKLLNNSRNKPAEIKVTAPVKTEPQESNDESYLDDNELVAVIASTIAMQMKTSVTSIVIKNIEKLDDRSPAWNRAGITEQMNSRF